MSNSAPISVTVRWTDRAFRSPYVLALQALMVLGIAVDVVPTGVGIAIAAFAGFFEWLDYFRKAREHAFEATITLEAASVVVRSPARRWLVTAKNLTGATTARGASGWDLTLQQRRAAPVVLEGLDESAVQAICQALGIGWKGVGTLQFRDARSPATPIVIAFISCYVMPIAMAVSVEFPAVGAAAILVWTAILAGMGRFRSDPIFTMAEAGMTFAVNSARYGIEWREFTRVARTEHELQLWTRHPYPQRLPIQPGPGRGALSRHEADLVVQHVTAAMDRARGLTRPRRLDVTGELLNQGTLPTAEWHAQLDRMAAELSGRGGGYRSYQLTLEQLHDVLQNPDAEPRARIGAARIVARLEGEGGRQRIELVRSSLRTEEHEAALEEALELQEAHARRA